MRTLTAAALLASLVACGELEPIDASKLPEPSAREARRISFEVCATSVERYGVERVARYLDAAATSPRKIARAYVRTALDLTEGWASYRRAGFRGCAVGVRAASG